jgi:hypothetical protein
MPICINDDAGRMLSATTAGAITSYSLNAVSRRGGRQLRRRRRTSSTTRRASRGEYDSAGNLIQEIVWFGDIPAAVLMPNGAGPDALYINTAHLGTRRKITGSSDNDRLRWDSDASGTVGANEYYDGDSKASLTTLGSRASIWTKRRGCVTTTFEITIRSRDDT